MSTIKRAATTGDVDATASCAETGEDARAAARQLLPLMWGIHVSRCVYAVAELGIADLLVDGAFSSVELAGATGSDESALYRVLRLLAALGVFEEHEHRLFGLTAARHLRRPRTRNPLRLRYLRSRRRGRDSSRAGVHTGEVELIGDDITGISKHIASRINSLAQPGEILVSRTVKDLVVGSGITFTERGAQKLNGVHGDWHLFAATEL